MVRIAFGRSFSLDKGAEKREGKKTEQFYTLTATGDAFAAEVAALSALAADEEYRPGGRPEAPGGRAAGVAGSDCGGS